MFRIIAQCPGEPFVTDYVTNNPFETMDNLMSLGFRIDAVVWMGR